MKRQHQMQFGAEVQTDGSVRFRLWAPGATRVDLCLEQNGQESLLPMTWRSGGWFELNSQEAAVGSRYRYAIDGGQRVPDPASRFQPEDVHGPSEVIEPVAFDWGDEDWRGRPWEEAVIYELHVGSFSPEGTFAGVIGKLDHLVEVGVTAIELMPVADFPGRCNWGYDGVLPFAPDASYGRPEDLKTLVAAAHGRGLMVFLDVVYNHFGPDGNYLHAYAPDFFTDAHHTPWGAAINFDQPGSAEVRRFFIDNALYWIEEFHFDGLRLDAVHAIRDDSAWHVLDELARDVGNGPGRERTLHLVLENDDNAARFLSRDPNGQPRAYTAQWNDDIHHAMHVVLTGEADGYYADYADRPVAHLGRCLTEGYAYQGDSSAHRGGQRRGESSRHLPPTAFVNFLQNHDQVGNRALGERMSVLAEAEAHRAMLAVLLLAPSPPLLFMGEEFATPQPFPFFCDFGPRLAQAVTEGRRSEFESFERFADPAARAAIPDPNDPATFELARLNWGLLEQARHQEWLAYYRELLELRRREIVPRLPGTGGNAGRWTLLGERGLHAHWRLGDGSSLSLVANLGSHPLRSELLPPEAGRTLFTLPRPEAKMAADELPRWSVVWRVLTASGNSRDGAGGS